MSPDVNDDGTPTSDEMEDRTMEPAATGTKAGRTATDIELRTDEPGEIEAAQPEALAISTNVAARNGLPAKARGFVLDRASGQPLPGVVVVATALADEGVAETTQGLLASDGAGYLAFDFGSLPSVPKHLWVQAVGLADSKLDLLAPPGLAGPGPHFLLLVDGARVARRERLPFPAVMNPDARDWELSPASFAVRPNLTLGEDGCEDGCGCETMLPSTAAERDFRVRQVVRHWPAPPPPNEGWNNMLVPLDPGHVPFNEGEDSALIAYGEVLEFRQRWFPLGHSLGELLYSLALAPCESVNIAVIDWSREDTAERRDDVRSSEALFHRQRRDRTISETLEAALEEAQGGWSLLGGFSQAQRTEQASSGEAGANVPIEGIPVSLKGSGSQAHGLGQLLSAGGGIAQTWGNRDLSGSSQQQLHDLTRQASSLVRTLSSTVVVQTTQDEHGTVQTRTVTNHNHCHALTMQYYEVLRHFRTVTEFVERRPVVLIPYKVSAFTWELALRFRSILEPLVDSRVRSCFDAVVRLHLCPGIYTLPQETGSNPGSGAGEEDEREISAFSVTLSTTSWNWSTTWGEVWVDVWVKSAGTWTTIWHKDRVGKGAPELNKLTFPQQVSGQHIAADDIGPVQVRWQEDNGNDSWDLGGIKITAEISSETGSFTLIDAQGASVPAGSKSNKNALRFFDDSGAQPLATAPLPTNAPPPAPASGAGGTGHGSSSAMGGKARYVEEEDKCCEQRLLAHLNGDIGFFSRALWLLQDPVERRVMLDAALVSKPWLRGGVDDMPLAVSGNFVAFAYQPADADQSGEEPAPPAPIVDILSLPTRGVFAEGQLGHCNSCEHRDVTRFWQWEESPCPETAPKIDDIHPGPTGQPVPVTPAALPASVLQIMSPPNAPDPVGLGAALELLGTANIFRDMSGMAEVQKLLEGLSSGALTLAQAKALAQEAKDNAKGGAAKGGGTNGRTPPSEPDAGKQVDKLDVVRKALDSGLIDKEQAADAATGILGGSPVGGVHLASTSGERTRGVETPYGVDVFRKNGAVDWDKVAKDGIQFAFAKATEGATHVDDEFGDNWAGLADSPLVRGAYHLFLAGVDATKQADNFITTVGALDKPGDLPPVLDVEWFTTEGVNISAGDLVDAIATWVEKIEDHYGMHPIIYTALEWWVKFTGNSARFGDCPLWVTNIWLDLSPTAEPDLFGGWDDWAFHQYSGKGTVAGVQKAPGLDGIDMNIFNGSRERLWRLAGLQMPRGVEV
jgi:GH25 family lysozyme M1 (1,4-beta-N-acetylmuramidase)